ncbi:hypothetical protein BZA70DRAFT_274249 [Myxozyma melibiosi]|uniref:Uncharacterized protein n=1 Tax=Myxozyma melibiosi TaxID=54550 RepID=A0ABR1FFP6_9ASCO
MENIKSPLFFFFFSSSPLPTHLSLLQELQHPPFPCFFNNGYWPEGNTPLQCIAYCCCVPHAPSLPTSPYIRATAARFCFCGQPDDRERLRTPSAQHLLRRPRRRRLDPRRETIPGL